jgi:hypothetical protein
MHSIKTKITAMTVSVIMLAMVIATFFGVTAIREDLTRIVAYFDDAILQKILLE